MSNLVFISDLHLSPDRPDIIELFIRFCDEVAANADELYILGDFMEYWIGDDDTDSGLEAALTKLKSIARNVDIKFMHGNRDFLVGNVLADRYDFSLIEDPTKITIDNQHVLLMHGDTLCTDDTEYQAFRQMVRNPQWISTLLEKPLEERRQLARSLREKSSDAASNKPEAIMDVNQTAVDEIMAAQDCQVLIHGHTHRPAIHNFDLANQDATRIVLGDWYTKGSYLQLDNLNNPVLRTYG